MPKWIRTSRLSIKTSLFLSRSAGKVEETQTGVLEKLRLIKSPLSIALIYTTRRRIPASASTNQGPEKGDLVLVAGKVEETQTGVLEKLRLDYRDADKSNREREAESTLSS